MKTRALIASLVLSLSIMASIFIVSAPIQVRAQADEPAKAGYLIFCNTDLNADTGQFTDPCNFETFVGLAIRIINLAMYLVVPLAALSFSYAGFKILTAGGNSGEVAKAKNIFEKVAIGMFWILSAWLVVNTILHALVGDGYSLLKNS